MWQRVLVRVLCVSLFNNRAVTAADLTPSTVQVLPFPALACAIGIFRSGFLIHLDAPTGLLIDIEVAVLHHRTSVENFAYLVVKGRVFLDSKVGAHQIERDIGGVADWRYVARTVPCGFHSEDLAH